MDSDVTSTTQTDAVQKSDRTRARILDSAAVVFREKGFERTRLSDIADRAELQAASLYYHFDDKEHLMQEVLSRGVRRTFAQVQEAVAAVDEDDALARLEVAISAHISTVLEIGNYSVGNLRVAGLPPRLIKRHQIVQRQFGRFWDGLLEEGQAQGALRTDFDVQTMRMLVLGALNWTVEWFRPGAVTMDDLIQQATDLILGGLRSRPASAAPARRSTK